MRNNLLYVTAARGNLARDGRGTKRYHVLQHVPTHEGLA